MVKNLPNCFVWICFAVDVFNLIYLVKAIYCPLMQCIRQYFEQVLFENQEYFYDHGLSILQYFHSVISLRKADFHVFFYFILYMLFFSF